MKKILVTGGAGFIGGALCKSLVEKEYDVFVIDNLAAGRLPPPGVHYIHGDITRWDSFLPLIEHEFLVIYHLAASFANRKSVLFPFLDAETNIMGTMNVIRLMNSSSSHFLVYTGSSSSYGVMASRPFSETHPIRPLTPYALSKYVGEQYIEMTCKKRAYLLLRLFNVFGPGDIPGIYRNAIPNMVRDAKQKGVIQVSGRDATRDFTYIDDVVAVLSDVAGQIHEQSTGASALGGQILNICTGVERHLLDIAIAVQKCTGADIEIVKPKAWDQIKKRCGSPEKMHNLFPYSANFRDAFQCRLEHTIESVRRFLKNGGCLTEFCFARPMPMMSSFLQGASLLDIRGKKLFTSLSFLIIEEFSTMKATL